VSGVVLLGHGSGGRMSQQLFAEHFQPRLGNAVLDELLDAAVLGDLALTTDAYVVTPRFFPGGDLGRLAVSGTVNDLAMVGAVPLGLTAAFILEEGLPLEELDRLVVSMADTAREADVRVVAGDTKVVARGACDGVFVTTSGVGRLQPDFRPRPQDVRPGDRILVSGTLGDHGMAVMTCRQGIPIHGELASDVAPLNGLVAALRSSGAVVHALRDPTRGGVAQTLLEVAAAASVRIVLRESAVPVRPPVLAACELLGLDPLYVANEGKLVCFVPAAHAATALAALRSHPRGLDAALVGEVTAGAPGVEVETALGARRSLRMAAGELLPRIC
jgi:hydrogenase expression/formation protein HypE